MGLGPPGLLGRPWPCQACGQVTCNPGAAVIHVYLSISRWPVCFFSDSKCPEALWRLPSPPTPQFTICLFLRCTEIRHRSLGTQAILTISRWRCISFVLSPDIGITSPGFFFFFLSLLLLLIFFSLLPQFSLPSFIAFCFLSASPSPLMFLVSGNTLSRFFLIQESLSWPSIIPIILVFFFLTACSLTFIPFPTLHYHLLEPLKSSDWGCLRVVLCCVEGTRALGDVFSVMTVQVTIFLPFCPGHLLMGKKVLCD